MRGFILGLAVGALGVYAALKLSDEETREEIRSKMNNATDKAKAEFDHGVLLGRGKILRARVAARQELRKGRQKVNEMAGDVAGKLSDSLADLSEDLSEIEAKARAKT